jgi:drug/metabolite transporter (DMT)-like permease
MPGAVVIARLIFALSIVGCFLGDMFAALAARGRFPVGLGVVLSTALFATGGIEALFIYRGMQVFTVAWLWPALMQLGHSCAAVAIFHERPSMREIVGSCVVLVGIVVAAT